MRLLAKRVAVFCLSLLRNDVAAVTVRRESERGRPAIGANRVLWTPDGFSSGTRAVAQETAIAFVIDGGAEAVMMASPIDLEEFAFGFLLNEGFIERISDVRSLDIIEEDRGIELRLWLMEPERKAMIERRRRRAGPAGCGLCGVESLEQALRPTRIVESSVVMEPLAIIRAMRDMQQRQVVNQHTRAMHAAGFFHPIDGVVFVREDVGRHNALDKLAGALAASGRTARGGVVLLTSRVSVELIQKAAMMDASIMAAISAPTDLALRTAEIAGICVVGVVREDGLEVFTHPESIVGASTSTAGAI